MASQSIYIPCHGSVILGVNLAVEKFTHQVLALLPLVVRSAYSEQGATPSLSQILTHLVLGETIILIFYRYSD